ncbi:MAG: ATP-dependent metallopeptidase FtsH/Yme1/Tma family protein, partial [Bacteroidota bacterium]
MADKPRQKKNFMGGPGRSNYQVWVIVVLIASVLGFTYLSNSNSAKEITDKQFEEMLLRNDVQFVLLIKNKDMVEVTLKEEALQNAKYRIDLENTNPFNNQAGPHYKFRIVDTKIFVDNFNRIQEQLPEEQRIGYKVEERSDF